MTWVMKWKGGHTCAIGPQSYFTNRELAHAFGRLAETVDATQYVELGVGEAALWDELPSPKVGVELHEDPTQRRTDVEYGVDALSWRPSHAARTCVVMNPPFCSQISFFNHAATFDSDDLYILWIAGCGVRWFDNDAKLAHHMYLIYDYDVPRTLQRFDHDGRTKHVRVCVQLWRRASSPRVVLGLPDCTDLEFAIITKGYVAGDIVVKRVGGMNKVGAVFDVCREPTATPTKHAIGTFAARGGTAFALRCRDAASRDALLDRLQARKVDRAFERVLEGRNSGNFVTLTMPVLRAVLSEEWRRLIPVRAEMPV